MHHCDNEKFSKYGPLYISRGNGRFLATTSRSTWNTEHHKHKSCELVFTRVALLFSATLQCIGAEMFGFKFYEDLGRHLDLGWYQLGDVIGPGQDTKVIKILSTPVACQCHRWNLTWKGRTCRWWKGRTCRCLRRSVRLTVWACTHMSFSALGKKIGQVWSWL